MLSNVVWNVANSDGVSVWLVRRRVRSCSCCPRCLPRELPLEAGGVYRSMRCRASRSLLTETFGWIPSRFREHNRFWWFPGDPSAHVHVERKGGETWGQYTSMAEAMALRDSLHPRGRRGGPLRRKLSHVSRGGVHESLSRSLIGGWRVGCFLLPSFPEVSRFRTNAGLRRV